MKEPVLDPIDCTDITILNSYKRGQVIVADYVDQSLCRKWGLNDYVS